MMHGMVTDMEEARLQTVTQVKAFLAGTAEIALCAPKAELRGTLSELPPKS